MYNTQKVLETKSVADTPNKFLGSAEEDPSLSMTDVSKKLGEIWKGMSDIDKAPFEVMICA